MTSSRLDNVCGWIVAVIYALLLAIGSLQVAARYLLGLSFAWTEELAVYLFIWLVFLGAGLGVARKVHPHVTVFVKLVSGRTRRVIQFVTKSAVVAVVGVLIFYGLNMVLLTRDNFTPGLGLPVGYVMYLALPVGAVLMLVNLIRGWNAADEPEPGEDGAHR